MSAANLNPAIGVPNLHRFALLNVRNYEKSRSRPQMVSRKSGWGGSRNTEDPYIVKTIGEKFSGRN